MGGIKINAAAEVLFNADNIMHDVARHDSSLFKPVLGLYAAGEVTGGVHGKNRLAGNSLLECVVFGRIAGKRAAQILEFQSPGA